MFLTHSLSRTTPLCSRATSKEVESLDLDIYAKREVRLPEKRLQVRLRISTMSDIATVEWWTKDIVGGGRVLLEFLLEHTPRRQEEVVREGVWPFLLPCARTRR